MELAAILKHALLQMDLNISDCRGQCYDGVTNMCSARNGVATQISRGKSRVICNGHALNLGTGDCIMMNIIVRR